MMPAEKILFKGENAKKPVNHGRHFLYTALSPCPDLWGDEVNNWNTERFKLRGHSEMKAGRVRENREVGLFKASSSDQLPETHPNSRQMSDYFHQTHHGKVFGTDYRCHADLAQSGSGTTEEPAVRPFLSQFPNQEGGIVVPGCLAG